MVAPPGVTRSGLIALYRFSCSMLGRMRMPQAQPGLGLIAVVVTHPAGSLLYWSLYMCMARPICLRLFWHFRRAAAARTFCTAGRSSPMRMAMMAMTTSSSISVNADRFRGGRTGWDIEGLLASEQADTRMDRTRRNQTPGARRRQCVRTQVGRGLSVILATIMRGE